MRRDGIAFRILFLLTFAGLVGLVVAGITALSTRQLRELLERSARVTREGATADLVRIGELTATTLSAQATPALLENNFTYLQEQVAVAARSEHALFAVCLDPHGRVLVKAGRSDTAELERMRARLGGKAAPVHVVAGGRLIVAAPIRHGAEPLGVTIVAFDMHHLEDIQARAAREHQRERSRALRGTFLAGGVVLILGILAAIALGLWLARPVARLASAASTLATGDFTTRAPIAGPTEIRALGRSFNEMAGRLEEAVASTARRAALDRELELARNLQLSLMPARGRMELGGLELCSWYAPAGVCGGDWWSVQQLEDDRVLLVVGDVMGHGMPAAFLAAAAKSTADTAARLRPSIDAKGLLRAVNWTTWRAAHGKLTTSCFVTLLDGRTGQVSFGGGGHPQPFRMRATEDGFDVALFRSRGGLLGSKDPLLAGGELVLEKGDVVVWYTDGMVERPQADERLYGYRRLVDVVGARLDRPIEEILEAVREDHTAFAGGREPIDDITLIVGRWTGAAGQG